MYERKNKGVCSRETHVEIEDGVVKSASVVGGCDGNSKGVAALIKDMPVEEAIQRLKGIKCGWKQTSCPDQIAITLEEALAQN